MKLTTRQEEILHIVQAGGPITGKKIAEKLSLNRATLRSDLAILTMAGTIDAKPRVGYFINDEKEVKLPLTKLTSQLVHDFQSKPIVIQKSTSVYDAIVKLFLEDVGTIYVINHKGYLSGVISRKDLLRVAIGNQNLNDLPVSVIMTRMPNILTVKPEETLLDAVKKMMNNQVDSLPVVRAIDEKSHTYEVLGRITKTTILSAYLEIMEQYTT